MGGSRSRVVIEREMTDVSEFKCNSIKQIPQMYPTSLDDVRIATGKTDQSEGFKRHSYVMKPEGDGQTSTMTKAESISSDTGSQSSHEFPHYSQGVDALSVLNKSPYHLQSTPKRNGNQGCRFSIGEGNEVACNGNHGDSEDMETITQDIKYCNCDQTNDTSSCEVIVTTHESVVSKKMLGPTVLRRSCTLDDMLFLKTRQKPKWKIEVDMESTRVIYGALTREPNDSFLSSDTISSGDIKIDMKDESTETDGLENLCDGESADDIRRNGEHFLKMTSSDNIVDEQKRKKTFWAKKKKRKHSLDKDKTQTLPSENGGTLKHRHFWPFTKGSSNSANHVLSNPKENLSSRQSLFEEKLKYLHIAARVNCPRAADVRATLLVEYPTVKLTNAQLSTKTYLLSVTLNAFFYPYPKIYVEWVDSLSDLIQERMNLGDIVPKFVTTEVSHCKVCLILSPDASVLLCKPDCALIPDLANIAGYSRRSTFVMKATDKRSQTLSTANSDSSINPISEKFAPISEIEEFDDEMLYSNSYRTGAQTM